MSEITQKARPGLFLRQRAATNVPCDLWIAPQRGRFGKVVGPVTAQRESLGIDAGSFDVQTIHVRPV
jgi:hypothetical protein